MVFLKSFFLFLELNVSILFLQVKDNMRLASIQRVVLTPEKLRYLDEISSHDSNMSIDSLYLAQLRSKNYVRGHSENTWPSNANEDDDDVKEGNSFENFLFLEIPAFIKRSNFSIIFF